MSLGLAIVLATTHLEYHHFFATTMRQHGATHGSASKHRRADLDVGAIGHHEHILDFHFGADFDGKGFYLEFAASGNFVLLATGLDHRVHACLQNWFDPENAALYRNLPAIANQCSIRMHEPGGCGYIDTDDTISRNVATSQEIDAFLAGVERRAFKQALFAIQDHHSALDVVQNAMLKLVERYADKPGEELPPLFQRILQNTIHDHFRRSKVRNFWVRLVSPLQNKEDETGETLESLAAHSEAMHQPGPDKQASGNQQLAAIELALSELPTRQREAFLLRYWEELDVAETAKAMGCSEGSVKTHCFRATSALAAKLKDRGISP